MLIWILIIGLLISIISGSLDGIVEGYEFDGRRSFERKWGVDPRSFYGSLSWKNTDTWLERMIGTWDFYHVADDIRSWGYRTSGILLGIYDTINFMEQGLRIEQVMWMAFFFGLGILSKRIGMAWIRK